ncbi:MAG: hypothetical protein WCW31_01080 [Patescibacteria group bacterium]|jgi:hypothetical protein
MRSLIAFAALLGMLVGTIPAQAATMPATNSLIKGSLSTVYYYASNGKRYVFPTEKTYKSWYGEDYSKVVKIDDVTLGTIPLGGNVTYRPGVKLLKITTDPKVYAIAAGGTLRWVKTEDLAKNYYGADWAKKVDDLPDPFFVNYKYGTPIENAQDFTPATETSNAYAIWVDKGFPAY